ncbi:trigger factor [Bacteroidota bacterium]
MDFKVKDLDNCKKEIDATLTYDELKPHFEKALLKYKQKVTIPGFRKGKAPLQMVKKLYGDSVEYTALEDIAGEEFKKYVIDNEVKIIDFGKMTDMDYKPKEKFTFKIEFEISPDVVIENYKNLELTKVKNVIDDSIVEEEIQSSRMRLAQFEIDGQALDDDYKITVDIQALDDSGNIIVGESQKDVPILLNNRDLFPEFREGLKEIKEEEERVIDTKDANDKQKKIRVACKKVEKIVLPEMDEEFIKKVTGKDDIKDEKEFRKYMKGEIETAYDNISEQTLRNDIVSEMIKLNDVKVPDKFVNSIMDQYVQDYKMRFPKNYNFKDFKEDEFRKEKRVDAIRQAKWFLMREKLIEMEKFEVSDEDLKEVAEKNAKTYNMPVDKLISAYKKNEDVKIKILNDKVMDFLIENANVKEKEEIRKSETKQKTKSKKS